jgi:hypothetical protein
MGSQNLWISLADGNRHDKLQGKVQNFIIALKNMNSKAAKDAAADDNEDD